MPETPIVTQQLVREIATQVIRNALDGIPGGSVGVIDACRDHPIFLQLPMEDRDTLIDSVFAAAETAQLTISWGDTIVAVVGGA